MSTPLPTPRLYFLTAKEAPIVVVLRRGPSKRYHVIKINTQTAVMARGSWFTGRLYTDDCDISFDGEWLVYKALGATGAVWTGLCRSPWLKTYREWENVGTWDGGGFFASRTQLQVNVGSKMKVTQTARLPFDCQQDDTERNAVGKIVRYDPRTARMLREGWRRLEPSQTSERSIKKIYASFGDPSEWICQPSQDHPRLRMVRRPDRSGNWSSFTLDQPADLLDNSVDWANWDALGNLIVARQGLLQKYTLADLATGQPSLAWDLRTLSPDDENEEKPSSEV